MLISINLLKILFFVCSCYLLWRVYKLSNNLKDNESKRLDADDDSSIITLKEGSDFFLIEEGVWCWIEDGEPVTTKEFHLSRGGAIEDYERYIEGKKPH